ncbi:unnamed protein product [Absidia cylindrospora]
MVANDVMFGGKESYHHMCRFQSGFFFDHPLLENYDWYWRVEPGVTFFCDITYDPFLYMQKYNKLYGFVVTLKEMPATIPTLWNTVLEYAKSRHIDTTMKGRSLFPFFRDQNGHGDAYNYCHFWSNFEIASLNLWRSPAYRDFFNYLDQTGNFFYERWGDAPGKKYIYRVVNKKGILFDFLFIYGYSAFFGSWIIFGNRSSALF